MKFDYTNLLLIFVLNIWKKSQELKLYVNDQFRGLIVIWN